MFNSTWLSIFKSGKEHTGVCLWAQKGESGTVALLLCICQHCAYICVFVCVSLSAQCVFLQHVLWSAAKGLQLFPLGTSYSFSPFSELPSASSNAFWQTEHWKTGILTDFITRWHTDGVRTGLKPLNSMLTGWRYVSTWNGNADHPSTHSETLAAFHHVCLYGNREKRQAVTLGSLALPFHSSYWVAMVTAPSEVVWPFHFGSRHQCCLFHNKIITRHPGSLIPRISFKSFRSDERLARFSVRPEKNEE